MMDVRREQRASLLAYAFIRGRRYRDTEVEASSWPNLKRVSDLVKVFGSRPVTVNDLSKWVRARARADGISE